MNSCGRLNRQGMISEARKPPLLGDVNEKESMKPECEGWAPACTGSLIEEPTVLFAGRVLGRSPWAA